MRVLLSLLFSVFVAFASGVTKTIFDGSFKEIIQFGNSPVDLNGVFWSNSENDKTWIPLFDRASFTFGRLHDHDKSRAFLFKEDEKTVTFTLDSGRTWSTFQVPIPLSKIVRSIGNPIIDFHPKYPDWLIWIGESSDNGSTVAFVSTDNGISWNFLSTFVTKCLFGQDVQFKTIPESSVLCLSLMDKSVFRPRGGKSLSLIYDFGSRFVTVMEDIMGFFVIDNYLLTAVVHNGVTMDLHISTNGVDFKSLQMTPTVSKLVGATLLDSSSGNIFTAVHSEDISNAALLYSSDPSGVYAVQSLESNLKIYRFKDEIDWVSFGDELPGVYIINTIDSVSLKTQSRQTFNNGALWLAIPPPKKDSKGNPLCTFDAVSCSLHLHGQTNRFQTEHAAFLKPFPEVHTGFAVGVGVVGPGLADYASSGTWLTFDAGQTWKELSKDPRLSLLMGNLLIHAPELIPTTTISYSIDIEAASPDTSIEIMEIVIFDRPFIIKDIIKNGPTSVVVIAADVQGGKSYISTVEFNDILSKLPDCDKSKDYIEWSAPNGCLQGSRRKYFRRDPAKPRCKVLSGNNPKPLASEEKCSCSRNDFECNYGYIISSGTERLCVRDSRITLFQPSNCAPGSTWDAPGPYRKISGNICSGGEEEKFSKGFKLPCESESATSKVIDVYRRELSTNHVLKSVTFMEDFIVLFESKGSVLKIDMKTYKEENISPFQTIQLSKLYNGNLILLGKTKSEAISFDKNFYRTTLGIPCDPLHYFENPPISEHPTDFNKLVFVGIESSGKIPKAFYSNNYGSSWSRITSPESFSAVLCSFYTSNTIATQHFIFCQVFDNENDSSYPSLYRYELPQPEKTQTKLFNNVQSFKVISEYLIVAVHNELGYLELFSSLNGYNFASFQTYKGINLSSSAFTILDVNGGNLSIDLFTKPPFSGDFLISNSNGTYFSSSHSRISHVSTQLPEIEKISPDGTILANVFLSEINSGVPTFEKIKSVVSFDGGREWNDLTLSNGACKKLSQCNHLQLSSISPKEMIDPSKFLNNYPKEKASTIGVVFGVGVVSEFRLVSTATNGKSPLNYNTFMSVDGGNTWRQILDTPYELNASLQDGSIFILAKSSSRSSSLLYSIDNGNSWLPFKFTSSEKEETEKFPHVVSLVPFHDMKLLLELSFSYHDKDETEIIILDFNEVIAKECSIDDFESWIPEYHNGCYLGQKFKYFRKKANITPCKISAPLHQSLLPKLLEESCACTEEDFECDYGHVRDESNGKCVKLNDAGLPQECNERGIPFPPSTGYRKIPKSKCSGGLNLASGNGDARFPCGIFSGKAGLSSASIFLIVFICFFITGAFIGIVFYLRTRPQLNPLRKIRRFFSVRKRQYIALSQDDDFLLDDYAHE